MNFHEYLKKKKRRKTNLIFGMVIIFFLEVITVAEMRRSAIMSAFVLLDIFIISLWSDNIENINEKDRNQIKSNKK